MRNNRPSETQICRFNEYKTAFSDCRFREPEQQSFFQTFDTKELICAVS
ncbi:hypothetical protein NEISUBOT_03502 [Neisseria subflava NJ9703]|uniref:Uncharacterized protein n=1 Tax=Neisseria subflava NJ9703 TaxID=546268 RepID=A0A9W5N0M8_NEISU|nr:hypothetical protein NEISUBOT_03502 [Neisseria subflava NJ9703]